MTKLFNIIRTKFADIFSFLFGIGRELILPFAVILTLFATLSSIMLMTIRVSGSYDTYLSLSHFYSAFGDLLWGMMALFFPVAPITEETYNALLRMSDVYLMIVSFCVVIVSTTSTFYQLKEQDKRGIVRIKKMPKRRTQSAIVKTMADYYKNSEQIVVVAGDYDWLFQDDNKTMVPTINDLILRNAITLISNKSPETVAKAWQKKGYNLAEHAPIFRHIAFGSSYKVRASAIRYKDDHYRYIYLYSSADESERVSSSICSIRGVGEGKNIVRFTFDSLMREHDAIISRNPDSDAAREAAIRDFFKPGS